MQKIKENYKQIILYLVSIILFWLLAKADIGSVSSPFAYALFFALLFCGAKPIPLTLCYILALIPHSLNLHSAACVLSVVIVANILSLIYVKTGKQKNIVAYCVCCVISALPTIYVAYVNHLNLLLSCVSVFIGLAFLLCCANVLGSVFTRGLNTKLTLDESICAGIIIVVLGIGLASVEYLNNFLLLFVGTLLVLFVTFGFSNIIGLICSICLGIGASLYFNNVVYISVFSLFALTIISFKGEKRVYSVLALLITHSVLCFYFNVFKLNNYYVIIPVLLACVVFLALPKKCFNEIYNLFGETKENTMLRNIVNRSREGLTKRMTELSAVFQEMNCVFRNMVKGGLPKQQVQEMIISEIKEKVCMGCPDHAKCHRTLAKETQDIFSMLADVGFEKGRTTIVDVPASLTIRCGKVNPILTKLNNLLENYKQYASMITNMDSSRILIADQLNGVSKLLLTLAEETKRNVTFDYFKEEKVMQELNYNNILANQVIIYQQSANDYAVSVLVRNSDIDKNIAKVVSKVIGIKMATVVKEQSEYAGLSLVTLRPAPNFDVSYGCASCCKLNETVSGDTHSAIRLSDNKIMFALCDGMGSGEKAEKISNLSISLIENFYKAGFEDEIILSSANKLLTLSQEERFSALDICVIDLSTATCDLIKIGSSASVLKQAEQSTPLLASSLPLGILEEIKPSIYKLALNSGNIMVLCSDGVVDSFENTDMFTRAVNNITSLNPQQFAQDLLDIAIKNNSNAPKDDMTVLVLKVFEV